MNVLCTNYVTGDLAYFLKHVGYLHIIATYVLVVASLCVLCNIFKRVRKQ